MIGSDGQPMPKDGKEIVMPHLVEEFNQMAKLRYEVGIERYGTPLKIFNGRDAGQDAAEELFDLAIYLKQLRMEKKSLEAENTLLKMYVADIQARILIRATFYPSFEDFCQHLKDSGKPISEHSKCP